MKTISSQCRDIAKHLSTSLAVSRPPIRGFLDESGKSEVFIMTIRDSPQPGVTAVATVGLSEHPLMKEGQEFPSRVELIAACGENYHGLDHVLATLAFGVMNSQWFCAPGVIFPGAIAMHGSVSTTMSDMYFTYPFLWEDRLKSTEVGGHMVAWLLALPVSTRETEYARVHGPQQLEQLFKRSNIDIFDLNRISVV